MSKEKRSSSESTESRDRRDLFIAAALSGLCANPELIERPEGELARFAVDQADAVLNLIEGKS